MVLLYKYQIVYMCIASQLCRLIILSHVLLVIHNSGRISHATRCGAWASIEIEFPYYCSGLLFYPLYTIIIVYKELSNFCVIVFSVISMLLLSSTFCVARIDLREPVK